MTATITTRGYTTMRATRYGIFITTHHRATPIENTAAVTHRPTAMPTATGASSIAGMTITRTGFTIVITADMAETTMGIAGLAMTGTTGVTGAGGTMTS